ncbi:hypothetical protein SARC_13951, partial [Sphaeroforma arctica JP610]
VPDRYIHAFSSSSESESESSDATTQRKRKRAPANKPRKRVTKKDTSVTKPRGAKTKGYSVYQSDGSDGSIQESDSDWDGG